MPKVGHSEWARDTDEEDRVELAIRKSGCWDEHIACVECMSEKSDWRKCQTPLSAFKECMQKYTQKKKEEEDLLRMLGASTNDKK
uniref:CHCH domain-containing protein n=1 Tax=Ascaris lumbricoides TaxID=6252 RepID=A0A0M3IAE6_ASCLU